VPIYLAVPLLVVVAVLQATVVTHLKVLGVFADLPLLVVVSWGLLRGSRDGLIWGFLAGVAVDVLSGAPFGAATLSLMAVGFLGGLARRSVYAAHFVFPMVLVFLVTILYNALFLLIVGLSGDAVMWLDSLLRIILPSAILNAALAPVMLALMRLIQRRFGPDEMEW
jgi:rod shape-determining protein MreD